MSAKLIEQIEAILDEKKDEGPAKAPSTQSLEDQRDFYARLIVQTGKDLVGYGEKLAQRNMKQGPKHAAVADLDAFRRAAKNLAQSLMVALRLDEQVDFASELTEGGSVNIKQKSAAALKFRDDTFRGAERYLKDQIVKELAKQELEGDIDFVTISGVPGGRGVGDEDTSEVEYDVAVSIKGATNDPAGVLSMVKQTMEDAGITPDRDNSLSTSRKAWVYVVGHFDTDK